MPDSLISLSDKKRITASLFAFLEGNISFDQLSTGLNEHMTMDFQYAPGLRSFSENELDGMIKISFKREYLLNAIERCLNGQTSLGELSNWAAFVFMSGFFTREGLTEEERLKEGEGPVWDILQQLITPQLFLLDSKEGLQKAIRFVQSSS